MNLDEHNLEEIEGLSQRGRILSIIDLIAANTLSVDMAAYALYSIQNGASFLTAARPGNAGKTTLLSCLLTFLPPDERIITISSSSVISEIYKVEKDKVCVICHEIGHGHIYGYLWGKYIGQMFDLMNHGCRIASCIHADTLHEMRNILVSRELGVTEDDFAKLGLILFMKLEHNADGYRRRVATFYESDGKSGNHNLLFNWDDKSDTFKSSGDHAIDGIKKCRLFIESLINSGNTDFRWVRKQVVGFYRDSN